MTHLVLQQPSAEIYVPDGTDPSRALSRTTHLGIGAHQDDLEILAAHGILECFAQTDRWFCGVVVTDGAGSARDFEYKRYTDEQMKQVRRHEQRKAAFVGEYTAQLFLDYPSSATKDASEQRLIDDLEAVLRTTRPKRVYTHNLADKHDTHVAVTLRVLAACRRLPSDLMPEQVTGCEVWRDLDWLCDGDKVAMAVGGREHLQAALLGVFDSQIAGGKRYDLATAGRRRAHATYYESHGTDQSPGLIWGTDLTPLLHDPELDPATYIDALIQNFRTEVRERIGKLR